MKSLHTAFSFAPPSILSLTIYYDDYINTLATVKAEDAQGNEYQYVDGDLKTRIQMKLVDAIPKWRGLRNVDDRFI